MSRLIAIIAIVLGTFGTLEAGDRTSTVSKSNSRAQRSAATKSVLRSPTSKGRPATTVKKVAFQEPVMDEGMIVDDVPQADIPYEGDYVPESMADSCSDGCSDPCNLSPPPARLVFMFPGNAWVQMDYLMWWQSGMRIPPLLTTSRDNTTPANASGILGLNGTRTLLGDDEFFNKSRSGGRIKFGWWFANNPNIGFEGEYFNIGGATETFLNQSSGAPQLARPFFNVATGRNDSELVGYPGIATGSFQVDAMTDLKGGAVRFRRRLACGSCQSFSELCGGCVPTMSRIEATLGWRNLLLTESLKLHENLQSQVDQGRFSIDDNFYTRNIFNGAELGVMWHGRRGLWSLDSLLRLSIGNVNQRVTINGGTQITPQGAATQTFQSGFLTQRSNIGVFERDVFAVVPEFGSTMGYQLTPRARLLCGYTLMFLSNVVRPGDQIDTDLNPNLLPPAQNVNNQVERPQFRFVESDYWVQGLNFGMEFRW